MADPKVNLTSEVVLQTHREVFYRALLEQNFDALSTLYSDDYMLVRSDGSVLGKAKVLHDLKQGGLAFKSIELTDAKVRIFGTTAILTGESRTVAVRNETEITSRFRLVAVYVGSGDTLNLVHFQSTSLPD
jgi:Domain of unknown function (DUF4440)